MPFLLHLFRGSTEINNICAVGGYRGFVVVVVFEMGVVFIGGLVVGVVFEMVVVFIVGGVL